MNGPLWFSNLAFWSVQVALLVAAAGFLPKVFQIREPRVLLAYWRTLLAISLLLPLIEPWRKPPNIDLVVFTPDIVGAIPAYIPGLTPWHFFDGEIIAEITGLLILAGIIVRFVLLALGLLKLRQFRRGSSSVSTFSEVVTVLEEMRVQVNARAQFRLSNQVDSPVTFGFVVPVILLPERFPSMDARFQAAIACHELLHVRRHDWVHHLAEEVFRAALWFHPAIAWVISRARLAREQVVDLEVVKLTGTRKTYLEALLEFADSRVRVAALLAPPFLVERQLAERASLILKGARMSRTRLTASLSVVACCITLAATLVVWAFPLRALPRPPQGTSGNGATQNAAPKIVVADLRIGGDVQNVDAARARILKKLEGLEFDGNSGWLAEIAEGVIRADFQNRGYFKVLLDHPEARPLDSDGHRMLVSIHINEGRQFRTGQISIVSYDPAHPLRIPQQELRQQFQLQTGDVFNAASVRLGISGVVRLYEARGYASVTVMPEVSVDDKNHLVVTTVHVHEGNPFRSKNFDELRPDSATQAPAPSGTDGVGHPSCLYCPAPEYPKAKDTTKLQIVSLMGVITESGIATNIQVVKSAGLDFDTNALEIVGRWRFQPATDSNGKSVSVLQEIDVAFHPLNPQTQQ